MTRNRIGIVTLVVVVALAAGACGNHSLGPLAQPPSVASQPRIQASEGTTVAALAQARDYSGAQVQLDPPGSASPAVNADRALAACSTMSAACHSGSPSKEELALMTNPGFGYDQKLVWAITWSGVSCMNFGPPGQPSPGVNMATGCEFVTFIDASTATYLFAIDGPTSWG